MNLDFQLPSVSAAKVQERRRRAGSPTLRPTQPRESNYTGLMLVRPERLQARISRPKSMSKLGARRVLLRRLPDKTLLEPKGEKGKNIPLAGEVQGYEENEAMTQEEMLSESLLRHLADIQQIQADLRTFKEAKLKTPIFRFLTDSLHFPAHVANVLKRAEKSYAHIGSPKPHSRWPSSVRQRYQQTPKREQTATTQLRAGRSTGAGLKLPPQKLIAKNAAAQKGFRKLRA